MTDWIKRAFDVIISAFLLIILTPIIACIALTVWLDSPGPVFYRQERIGHYGRKFRMLKFRSMYVCSDEAVHKSLSANWFSGVADNGTYKSLDDPRITRSGRWLRRTSLDELPQLFNVIRGQMSLVGPRPAVAHELDYYLPSYFERQIVKPGMTGLWQVLGRERLSAAEMMNLDLKYVRDHSVFLDLRILFATIPVLFAALPQNRSAK